MSTEKNSDIKIDVIIPVYKPTKKLIGIVKMLEKQTCPVNKIILMNTERQYFEDFFADKKILKNHDNIEVHHVTKEEFDHGKTRDQGVNFSKADYFVCMTDDAVPLDQYLIENLVTPVKDGEVAVAYGRQCTGSHTSEIEKFTRKFNYPEQSYTKSAKDLDRLGIKTYFCSNVCACYDRAIYDKLGGFIKSTIFNEDMIYAARAVKAGYSIGYCANARVMHYHIYTDMAQLKRNFDLGVSQADHPEIFADVPSAREGKKMVKETVMHLISVGKFLLIPKLVITSGFKYIGYLLGKNYRLLPQFVINKVTMNPGYWKNK